MDQAIDLFREQGYAATSINDVVKATGVNRFSLYETFGDKHGLFLKVLDRFHQNRMCEFEELFSRPGPKLPLIREYFDLIKAKSRRNRSSKCLITVSAVSLASTDPEVAERVTRYFRELETLFVQTLQEAKDQGEICPETNLLATARTLINGARGMRLIAQFQGFDEAVEDIIETTLGILRPTVAFQNACSE